MSFAGEMKEPSKAQVIIASIAGLSLLIVLGFCGRTCFMNSYRKKKICDLKSSSKNNKKNREGSSNSWTQVDSDKDFLSSQTSHGGNLGKPADILAPKERDDPDDAFIMGPRLSTMFSASAGDRMKDLGLRVNMRQVKSSMNNPGGLDGLGLLDWVKVQVDAKMAEVAQ